jgi:hypothetical protein
MSVLISGSYSVFGLHVLKMKVKVSSENIGKY